VVVFFVSPGFFALFVIGIAVLKEKEHRISGLSCQLFACFWESISLSIAPLQHIEG
jgi:hypothetical protein